MSTAARHHIILKTTRAVHLGRATIPRGTTIVSDLGRESVPWGTGRRDGYGCTIEGIPVFVPETAAKVLDQ